MARARRRSESSGTVQEPSERGSSRHDRLKTLLKEIGDTFGMIAETEYSDGHHYYDVIWKEERGLPPSHVFEVQDRGSLDSALIKLRDARRNWRCNVYIAVTEENDRNRIVERADPFLIVIPASIIEGIHRAVTAPEYREIYTAFAKRLS